MFFLLSFFLFHSLNKKFCIDAGFGNDLSPQNTKQGLDNFMISQEIGKFLSKSGHSAYFTRISDEQTNIRTRYHFSNYVGCDLLITMKRNSVEGIGGLGIEAYVRPLYNIDDALLTNRSLEYAASLGKSNIRFNEIKAMEEGVQMYSASPSTAFFLTFLTSEREEIIFQEYHKDYAKLIADALVNASSAFI